MGSGPAFSDPVWVEVASNGDLIVTDNGVPALFRVDPVSGNRTILSSTSVGTGLAFNTPGGLMLPEPGALAGLASCAAALVLLARRRRT